MDFSFNESQTAVSELARKIFRDRVTPQSLKAIEAQEERFDRKLWGDLATSGLLGTSLPESVGGSGHGLLELCALLQEVGAAVAPIPVWATLLLGASPIAEYGTTEQKQRLLPGVVSGETLLSAALTETGTGVDDPLAPEATARNVGDAWVLRGTKVCVPAAFLAERVLVPARVTSGGNSSGGAVALFLVDPRAKGVTLERQVLTTGEPHARMILGDARVDAVDVLGEPSRGAEILSWLLPRAVIGLCAMELGVVERVLRMTAQYTSTRQQFERPVATFQAVAQRAADAYVDVESIRVSTWQAAWRLSEGLPASREVAMAKFWAAEAGHRVVYAAQHLHGGMGFDLDYPLHRYYVWSKQIELTLGSASAHLARLGAEIAG
jgi:alkylation response protein AidB-like acyl-CoA dehydrogenase